MVHTSNNCFQRHRKKTLAALLVVAIAGTDLAATFLWNGYKEFRRKQNDYFRVQSKHVHHEFLPNVDRFACFWGPYEYSFSTNSLGFRDATNRTVPPSATQRRLLVIGDSFAEGIGVDYHSTFAGILAAELAAQRIEILNAAVSSYSPLLYHRKVKHLLEEVKLEFHELVVFLDISDIHDEVMYHLDADGNVVENAAYPTGDADARTFLERMKDAALDNSLLAGATHRLLRCIRNQFIPKEDSRQRRDHWGLDIYRARWTIDNDVFAAYGRLGLQNAAENLKALHSLASAHNIRMILVVYPWPDQIFAGDRDSKQVTEWAVWAEAHGVEFINLFPPFFVESDRTRTLDKYFIRADCHWNSAGHRLIADEFLRAYLRQDSVDASK